MCVQAAGRQQTCLVTWLIEHQKELGMTDEECWWTSGTLYQAGSDTVRSLSICPQLADNCTDRRGHLGRRHGRHRVSGSAEEGAGRARSCRGSRQMCAQTIFIQLMRMLI